MWYIFYLVVYLINIIAELRTGGFKISTLLTWYSPVNIHMWNQSIWRQYCLHIPLCNTDNIFPQTSFSRGSEQFYNPTRTGVCLLLLTVNGAGTALKIHYCLLSQCSQWFTTHYDNSVCNYSQSTEAKLLILASPNTCTKWTIPEKTIFHTQ